MTFAAIYINNEPYLHDTKSRLFMPETPGRPILTHAQVARRPGAYHLASLWIVDINGDLYYDDTRLKEFRQVHDPSRIIPYDLFVPRDEGGPHCLSQVSSRDLVARLDPSPTRIRRPSRPRR